MHGPHGVHEVRVAVRTVSRSVDVYIFKAAWKVAEVHVPCVRSLYTCPGATQVLRNADAE